MAKDYADYAPAQLDGDGFSIMDDCDSIELLFTAAAMLAERAKRVQDDVAKAVAPHGLSSVDAQILWRIDQSMPGGLSQIEIARRTGTSTTQVCGAIERLVAVGWVETVRSATDRRRQDCRITESGRSILESATVSLSPLARACLAQWPIRLPQQRWEDAA